jgi:hypothetical protein
MRKKKTVLQIKIFILTGLEVLSFVTLEKKSGSTFLGLLICIFLEDIRMLLSIGYQLEKLFYFSCRINHNDNQYFLI